MDTSCDDGEWLLAKREWTNMIVLEFNMLLLTPMRAAFVVHMLVTLMQCVLCLPSSHGHNVVWTCHHGIQSPAGSPKLFCYKERDTIMMIANYIRTIEP